MRISKDAVRRAMDAGLDAFVKALNKELDLTDPDQRELIPEARTEGQEIQELVTHYINVFRVRYGPKAMPDVSGKARGVLIRMRKHYSQQQMKFLLSKFLQMEEQWFKDKSYDLVTLESQLQKVILAASTGRQQAEKTNLERAGERIAEQERGALT
jgi:hypothetical protein